MKYLIKTKNGIITHINDKKVNQLEVVQFLNKVYKNNFEYRIIEDKGNIKRVEIKIKGGD